ncbi:tetratricopeptide repeat protein [Bacteroidales bacterium OttesenSCG-928-J19]|nr:tetratricopeptide repeat protein [Bacteroidales bacterium OttesenSCG-928-J19]
MGIRRIGLLIVAGLMISLSLLRAEEPVMKSFDDYYLEGLRLKLKGEHQQAMLAFESALKLEPNSSAALYELSHYYLATQQTQRAYESLRKAMENAPDITRYKLALANLCRDLLRYDEAIELYSELSELYPERVDLYFNLSELYLRTNEIDKAIESLDNMENNMGINEGVSLRKYQFYKMTEQPKKAIAEVEKLRKKYPSDIRFIIIAGDFYLEENQTEKALEYYEKAYALDPANPHYFVSMANYYEQIGDKEGVHQEIEKALRSPQMETDTKLDILDKYMKMVANREEDKQKVDSLLSLLTELHPREKELNMIYGEYLLKENKPEEAKFQFQLVTEMTPDNKKAWDQLLALAVKEKNSAEITQICKDALLHFSDVSEFYYYLSVMYLLDEDYDSALQVLLDGISHIPSTERLTLSNFYGETGDLYHKLGQMDQCYEAYDKALEYNENHLWVLNNYAYFLALDGKDLDRAERMSAKTVKAEPNNPTYIDTYAWILYLKGNYSLAKFYIERVVNLQGAELSEEIKEHYKEILQKYEENK